MIHISPGGLGQATTASAPPGKGLSGVGGVALFLAGLVAVALIVKAAKPKRPVTSTLALLESW